jgi:steroid 5-alpha reductase family enzyme
MFTTLLVLFRCYVALFLLSLYLKDNSIADIFWGIGFLIITCVLYFLQGDTSLSQNIILVLIALWALRISLYIFSKKLKKSGEDPRYAAWRSEWTYFKTRSFFQVYMLQMILMCIVALPVWFMFLLDYQESLSFTIIGALLALFGLVFETVADWQLSQFMKIKRPGQIFTSGLYSISRHPNYFGESVFWFGISIIALQANLFALLGWAVITYLLLFVSGVPMLEKRYEGNKDFEEYKKKVGVFIPWVKM